MHFNEVMRKRGRGRDGDRDRDKETEREAREINQGILSVPGIAGYDWVPARIGRFYKDKIFFS